jgi:ubiquinone biosynthesis protein COQ9
MTRPPERLPERDAAIDAMLPHVPFEGWTTRALRSGLAAAGMPEDEATILFPLGAADMVAVFCDLADRRMTEAAAALIETQDKMGLTSRVRAVIALRLAMNRPHKEAIRRALALLALPGNAREAAAITSRTVDAIWHAAGDRSSDFSWYTKRAILTAIYGTALLFWLHDTSENDADTRAFIDRRLHGVGRLGRARGRAKSMLGRLRPA